MWNLREKTLFFTKCVLLFIVVIYSLFGAVDCGRYGGGRSRGGSSWSSRSRPSPSYHPSPSYSRPSPSPSYSHPSPSYSHPSPSSLSYPSWHPAPASRPAPSPSHTPSSSSGNQRPLGFENVKPVGSAAGGSSSGHGAVGPPNYGFNTHGSTGSNTGASHGSNPPGIGFKPSVTHGTGSNSPSYGFKPSALPAEHATNTKPLGTANSGHSNTGSSSGNPPPYGFKPSAPLGPPTNVKPVGNLPPGAPYQVHPPPYTPHNPGIPPPAYNPAHNPAGYGPPPAYNPSYNPAGYGHPPAYNPGYGYGGYPQQQYHPGGYGYSGQHYTPPGGVTNININNINTNTHHYGGGGGGGFGYGGGYSGFGYHYPSYHYSSGDVGSGALGFFLGYSLAKVTTPTYHYSSFSSGYTPRYDHYEVHHYYHNRDAVPAQSTIQPNTIVGCVGDSGTICPAGTTSLCTNNGAILCVASATSTVPCTDGKQGNCVKTTIPCVNGTSGCEVGQNTTLTIPCISKAMVPGNITYVNNTIMVNHTTIINNGSNNSTAGNGTITSTNSTTLQSSSTVENSTVPLTNLTVDAINLATGANVTEVPTTLPPTIISDGTRSKRETPTVPVNDFCVTILALPAERKPTEQEEMVKKSANLFSKFLVKSLGVH